MLDRVGKYMYSNI